MSLAPKPKTQVWSGGLVSMVVAILYIASAFGQSSETNHWEVGLATTDADISPDDRLLAVTLETRNAFRDGHEQAIESIEVWDFRGNSRLTNTQLAVYPKIAPTPNVVRFTADGGLLVASEPTKLHVLDASTLKSIRVIEPPLDDDFRIFHVETGPIGHIAIVGANR